MRYLLILLVFLTACQTLKQDQKRVNKIHNRHPELIQSICTTIYQPKDSIHETIEYIQGATIISYDTITIDCDTVKPGKITKIPCPPSKTRVDTFYKDKFEVVVNKAKVDLLTKSNDSLAKVYQDSRNKEVQLEAKINKKNKTILYLSIILGIIAIIIGIKIYLKRFI